MFTLAIISLTAVVWAATPALAQTPELDAAAERAIVNVAGDLYQFRSGKQDSLFLVTSDGIVVVDPLGLYAASWLNKELQTRFSQSRVRYVVLTHHHADRAGGAGLSYTSSTCLLTELRRECGSRSNSGASTGRARFAASFV